jgi:hypothetical protein
MRDLLILLLSAIGIYFGADHTVASITDIASRLSLPASLIALTVLSLGTTLPELAVNIAAIKEGKAEMAVGNVLGSCIFNTLVIPFAAGAAGTVTVTENLLTFSLPVMLGAGHFFYLLTLDKRISRWEGWLFAGCTRSSSFSSPVRHDPSILADMATRATFVRSMNDRMWTERTITLALLAMAGVSAQAQFPFATLHYQADASPYFLNGLHLELRADGHPFLLASGDTIHFSGLDTTGAIQWTSALAQPAGQALMLTDLLPLEDGTFAACGYSYQPAPELGLYLHLDAQGNVLSARTYSLSFNTRFFGLAPHANGNVRIIGYQQQAFPVDHFGIVLDVEPDGDLLSASSFSIAQVATLPTDVIPTADGGHAVIGGSWTVVSGQIQFKSAHIAKLDSAGQMQWARRFVAAGRRTYPQGVVRTAHGDLVYCMRAEFQQGNKAVLVTLDTNGNEVGVVQLDPDPPSNGYLDTYALMLQGDSAIVLSGLANGGADAFTLHSDTALNVQTMMLHDRVPGEWTEDAVIFDDGRILEASYATSPVSGNCILLRGRAPDGSSGCPSNACTVSQSTPTLLTNSLFTQNLASPIVADVTALFPTNTISLLSMPTCLSTGVRSITGDRNIQLLPNPASKEVRITGADLRQVQVLDATGRLLVDRRTHATDMCTIGLEDLPNSLLVVRVRTGTGWSTHRLVKD